jgi:hypothetical protein
VAERERAAWLHELAEDMTEAFDVAAQEQVPRTSGHHQFKL